MVLIYRICTTVVLLIAVLSAIILLWKKWLTPADTTLLISAFLVFSCLWLVQAALFVVQKPYWFAITMVFSGSVTLLLLQGANWLSIPSDLSLIIGTIVGLCCVLIIAGIVIKKTFLQQAADSPVGRQAIALPSRSHLVATLTPYFLYGLLYTMLIISGHIPGWIDSVAEGKGITAVVFLEFSLTAALIGFILVGGIIENILRRFWYAVQRFQQQMSPTQLNLFTQSVTHFYQTERKRFLKGLIICNGIILVTALMLFYASLNTMLIPQAWHTEMVLMFILALFGYSLMAFGIFNSMFMLTLSQPQKANAAIFVSIIVTLIFGIIVGLFTPYYVSVAGILVGNLVFALISDRKLKTVWRDADYYYFASF